MDSFKNDSWYLYNRKRLYSRLIPYLFFLFIVFFATLLYPDVHDGYYSNDWPITKGIIMQSQMVNTGLSKGCIEVLEFKYSFLVGNTTYAGKNFRFGNGCNKLDLVKITQEYPLGSNVVVHYNPEHPDRNVIIPGISKDSWIGILGFGFMMLICILLFFVIY